MSQLSRKIILLVSALIGIQSINAQYPQVDPKAQRISDEQGKPFKFQRDSA